MYYLKLYLNPYKRNSKNNLLFTYFEFISWNIFIINIISIQLFIINI